MQIIFLMGGSNIQQGSEDYPLYLTELDGKLILEKQVDYCRPLESPEFIFCLKASDSKIFHADAVIEQIVRKAIIIPMKGETKGAVCTALLACSHLKMDDELVLLSVNDMIDVPILEILDFFRENNADCGVVAFHSVHPRYSFAKLDDFGAVCELAEKRPISKNALASFYYYKTAGDFVECAKAVIRKDSPVKDAFYISQTVNEIILNQKKVLMYKVPNSCFHPLKTETQLAKYLAELQDIKESK